MTYRCPECPYTYEHPQALIEHHAERHGYRRPPIRSPKAFAKPRCTPGYGGTDYWKDRR